MRWKGLSVGANARAALRGNKTVPAAEPIIGKVPKLDTNQHLVRDVDLKAVNLTRAYGAKLVDT